MWQTHIQNEMKIYQNTASLKALNFQKILSNKGFKKKQAEYDV